MIHHRLGCWRNACARLATACRCIGASSGRASGAWCAGSPRLSTSKAQEARGTSPTGVETPSRSSRTRRWWATSAACTSTSAARSRGGFSQGHHRALDPRRRQWTRRPRRGVGGQAWASAGLRSVRRYIRRSSRASSVRRRRDEVASGGVCPRRSRGMRSRARRGEQRQPEFWQQQCRPQTQVTLPEGRRRRRAATPGALNLWLSETVAPRKLEWRTGAGRPEAKRARAMACIGHVDEPSQCQGDAGDRIRARDVTEKSGGCHLGVVEVVLGASEDELLL